MSVVNTEKKQEFFFVLSVYLLLDYSENTVKSLILLS